MTRRLAAAFAMTVGLSVVVGAVIVASHTDRIHIGENILINRPSLLGVNNSPKVVRHPNRPRHLVVAHRVDAPGLSAILERSTDDGATWQTTAIPLPPGTEPCAASPAQRPCAFAPDIAFGPDGRLYVLYLELRGQGNSPARLWLATSNDGGRSLGNLVQVAGERAFQPRLAIAGDSTVHVVWLAAEGVAQYRLVGPARIITARSTDGGRTFSEPVPVSDADRERVGAPTPLVDKDGDLVVLYQDFKNDRRDFENLEGPPDEGPFALVLTRSSDGGRSLSRGTEIESKVVPSNRFLVFLPEHPSIASGDDGSLYVAWADGRAGDEDVFVRRSDDGGQSWAEPVRVNNNPRGDGTDQYLPAIAVAPGGRVDVLFYDRRGDPSNVMTDVFLASSTNGARSFANRRISSEAFDSRVGFSLGTAYRTDFGTRLGLDSTDGGAYAAWTDSRLGDQETERQDIFGARIGIASSDRLPSWLAWVPPVLAGGGLAWFAVSRRSRWSGWIARAGKSRL